MGSYADALGLEPPQEPMSTRQDRLVGLRAEVEPDGEATSFALQYTNHEPFQIRMPLLQAVSVMNEMRVATLAMIDRQRLKLDRGAGYIREICERAKRPSVVQIMVDPISQDRTFLFQFENEPPITVRISAEEMPMVLAQMARAAAKAAN